MADGRHFEKKRQMRYLSNRLTDFDEIWHGDAYLPYQADERRKVSKSKMADGGHLENRKIAISPKPFGLFDEILHDDTY